MQNIDSAIGKETDICPRDLSETKAKKVENFLRKRFLKICETENIRQIITKYFTPEKRLTFSKLLFWFI